MALFVDSDVDTLETHPGKSPVVQQLVFWALTESKTLVNLFELLKFHG